jgi:predicted CoA-substrate-specific enzyme activase
VRVAGIDVGSRTVKLAIVEDGRLVVSRKRENSFEPLTVCRELLEGEVYDRIVATGYGRHLFIKKIGGEVISEIKAAAAGARYLNPECRTILDIGGQDTKAISLDAEGRVGRFEMNDKCAAGTGRFLEVMAMALGCSLPEFTQLAESSRRWALDTYGASGSGNKRVLSSTCAVFAESEVVGLISRGQSSNAVANGIIDAIASRAVPLARRVGVTCSVMFIGGVALNTALGDELSERLGTPIQVPNDPQLTAALGCALSGM